MQTDKKRGIFTDREGREGEREPKPVSPLSHFPLCAKDLIIGEDNYAEVQGIIKKQIVTCVGVGTVAVTGTGVLGVASVEAAEGWGLELGTGCVEEGGMAVL